MPRGGVASTNTETTTASQQRRFEPDGITIVGTATRSATEIAHLKQLVTKDLNALSDMVRRSGNIELNERMSSLTIELDLDDWSKKYAGTQAAFGYGQAHFDSNRILLSAQKVNDANSMHDRVEHTVHEIFHLTERNNFMKSMSEGRASDPIEANARQLADDFMKKYWRAEYEFAK